MYASHQLIIIAAQSPFTSFLNHILLYLLFVFFDCRFFTLLGTVFAFVSNDIRSKIDILRKYLNDSDKQKSKHFVTVKRMICYERDNGLLQNSKYVSGCRTLLRLHRGLGINSNRLLLRCWLFIIAHTHSSYIVD